MELMIDPPNGYQYGFPKRWDDDKDLDLLEWLVAEGYPSELIEELGDGFYVRSWRVQ